MKRIKRISIIWMSGFALLAGCGVKSSSSANGTADRNAALIANGSCDASSNGICLDFQNVTEAALSGLCMRVNTNPYLSPLEIVTESKFGASCLAENRVGTCQFTMEGLDLTMRVYPSNQPLADAVHGLCTQATDTTPIPGLGGNWLPN